MKVVPLTQVAGTPYRPVSLALGILLSCLMLVIAFLGTGEPHRNSVLPAGSVSVAGVDSASEEPVTLDLSKPVLVRVRWTDGGPAANQAQLAFSAVGIPLLSSAVAPLTPSVHGMEASFEFGPRRYLVSGEVTAELLLLAEEGVLARHQFPARSTQHDLLTVPGILSFAALAFLAAYVESLLSAMRAGRRGVLPVLATLVAGAAVGVVLTVFGSMFTAPEPIVPTAVVCGTLGGLAAAAATSFARLSSPRSGKPSMRLREPGVNVFINYRDRDTGAHAARLKDRLELRFGQGHVFQSGADIQPGDDFSEWIDEKVTQSRVLLALIGREWLNARDEAGRPRIDDPEDWVRLEIQMAFEREAAVIPVLIGGAAMPKEGEVPKELKPLARTHGFIFGQDWNSEVARLGEQIERLARKRRG